MASEPGGQVPGSGVCVDSSDDIDNTALWDAGCDVGETETVDTDEEFTSEDQGSGDMLGAVADISETDFSTKSWKEDLTLIVEGKQLHVSSSLLAYMSPVFSAMFEEKFSQDGPREIELSEHQYPDFLEFLRCIYPTVKKRVTMENVFVILPLVNVYNVTELTMQCENVFVDHLDEDQTPRNICMLAQKALSYNMKLLQGKCVALAANLDGVDLTEAEREYPLPLDMKVEVLTGKVEFLQTRIQDLEEMVKTLWVDEGKQLNITDNTIGIIRIDLKKSDPFIQTVNPPFDWKGLQWTVSVDSKSYKNKTDYLEITLNASAISKVKKWSCQVSARMRILKRDSSNTHIWKCTYGTVKDTDPKLQFQAVTEMDKLWPPVMSFFWYNKVTIEVFILAEDLFIPDYAGTNDEHRFEV